MNEVQADGAQFANADLTKAILLDSNLCGANFAYAQLSRARFGELCPIHQLLPNARISTPTEHA